MLRQHMSKPIALALACFTLALALPAGADRSSRGHRDVWGPRFDSAPERRDRPRHRPKRGVDWVRHWNEIALDANGVDHTPVAPGEDRVFGEQLGPGRTGRALAIVHIAISTR
jgi:hypothetical protein